MSELVLGLAALAVGVVGGILLTQAMRRAPARDASAGAVRLEALMGAQAVEIRRLAEAAALRDRGTETVAREMAVFRERLSDMQAREQERRAREDEGWATLHRVASVLAGGQRAGRAGENVLREALAHLPPSMVVTDFRVNGKVVEFGLVLPDGRRLPVDSKWPAERELAALQDCSDPVERDRLVRAVERAVAERAREVAAYADPALTAPFGVAAVPDGAYAVLRRAHADAYRFNVVVVPYSMALPVLLFLYGIVSRLGGAADLQACLGDLVGVLDSVEATLENKVAKASTMLVNATDELRRQVGKARGTIARAGEGPLPAADSVGAGGVMAGPGEARRPSPPGPDGGSASLRAVTG